MVTILGNLAGALGLFFMGGRLLTEHLKMLTNRRLRLNAARWTSTRLKGFVWGLVAGAIMQSTAALTLVVVSLLKSDLISPKRGFPILLGCNVGGALLVLIVMLDVKLTALYILGIAQIVTLVVARDKVSRYRAMATACFGLALMVLGSFMIRESMVPLATYPWFQEAMEWVGDSLILPLVVGALLTLVTQSSVLVMVTGIAMAMADLLSIEQVLIFYCGACLGASLGLYLLTMTFTGHARQVAMYQVLYNVVLNAIFVPLVYVEVYFDVPLIAAAVQANGLSLHQSLAMFAIFSEALTAALQLTTLDLAVRWTERWWPPTEIEALAKPQFIHDRALDDVEAALRLVDLEQRHLLEMLSRYLDAVRCGSDTKSNQLREAANHRLGRLEELLGDLGAHCVDREMDVHNSLMTRQKLLTWLEEQVIGLCEVLHTLPPRSSLNTWSMVLVEGIDVVLLVLIDTLESDASAWPSTTQLMGERTKELRKFRDTVLKDESILVPDTRTKVLKLASITEHVFLLISQLTHEYRQASRVDEMFLEHADMALYQMRHEAPREDRDSVGGLALTRGA